MARFKTTWLSLDWEDDIIFHTITGCEPQYSHWKYAGNIVNICRLYLPYSHWKYLGNIIKYPLYLLYFHCFHNISRLFSDWKYCRYSLWKFTIFSVYFQWLYCGLHPVYRLSRSSWFQHLGLRCLTGELTLGWTPSACPRHLTSCTHHCSDVYWTASWIPPLQPWQFPCKYCQIQHLASSSSVDRWMRAFMQSWMACCHNPDALGLCFYNSTTACHLCLLRLPHQCQSCWSQSFLTHFCCHKHFPSLLCPAL